MATRYKAIRACFYGPPGYHTLFNVGDFLTEGWEPNHHFVPEHSFEGGADDAILGSGDDPRSTKKMAFDLKAVHGVELPAGTTRKEVFTAWVHAEQAARPVVKPEPVEIVSVDPLGTLKFADLTEKDIEALKAKEIIASMEFRFGLEVKHAGKSKRELVELGAELESKQVGARAP